MLAQAMEMERRGLYLAWRMQLRAIQVIEKHPVDGAEVKEFTELLSTLRNRHAGDTLKLKVLRGGEMKDIDLTSREVSHQCGVTMNDSVEARAIAEFMEENDPKVTVT